MSINSLLSELNAGQRTAATMESRHALVLAGAGCGKTKTIISRAAYLISSGTPANRIQILTFTRRSASEIVERVRLELGEAANGLQASTFHTWCMSLIRSSSIAFGCKGYSVIDRDDQLQLYRILRAKKESSQLPTAKALLDLYSFARNTRQSLEATLVKNAPNSYSHKTLIAKIMLAYEARKKERRYLDYDDILDVVAQSMANSQQTCSWVGRQYDHILVDEMQDTNPLQWKLIDPLKDFATLFCVGDDAQSIYGFRGADFRNVHSFAERVPGSITLKLDQNYRSTQEILDTSNWLLSESPLTYEKKLVAARGSGNKPQLFTFVNEWEEGRWIAEDLSKRRASGAEWRKHMILVRSSFAGRIIESALLAKDIPYHFIGGTKLLESAHVRDVLSVMRIVANPQDEIGWMRFLSLWDGIGEVTANRVIERVLSAHSLDGCIQALNDDPKIPSGASTVIQAVSEFQNSVLKAFSKAVTLLNQVLQEKYKNQDWDKRQKDFRIIEKLSEKHVSILGFIEEYLLDPVYGSEVKRFEVDDTVTVITIHSAKGTEREVCYVINVTPGAYPSQYAIGNYDEVEEERRVLYVALTRAKDELIVTRQGFRLWAKSDKKSTEEMADGDTIDDVQYFFNKLPEGLFEERVEKKAPWRESGSGSFSSQPVHVGIDIGFLASEEDSKSHTNTTPSAKNVLTVEHKSGQAKKSHSYIPVKRINPSPELAVIVSDKPISEKELTAKFVSYFRQEHLKTKSTRLYKLDDKLKPLFDNKDQIAVTDIGRLIKRLFK